MRQSDYHIQINIFGDSIDIINEKNISLDWLLKNVGIYDFIILEIPQTNRNKMEQEKPYINFETPQHNNLVWAPKYSVDDSYTWGCSTPLYNTFQPPCLNVSSVRVVAENQYNDYETNNQLLPFNLSPLRSDDHHSEASEADIQLLSLDSNLLKVVDNNHAEKEYSMNEAIEIAKDVIQYMLLRIEDDSQFIEINNINTNSSAKMQKAVMECSLFSEPFEITQVYDRGCETGNNSERQCLDNSSNLCEMKNSSFFSCKSYTSENSFDTNGKEYNALCSEAAEYELPSSGDRIDNPTTVLKRKDDNINGKIVNYSSSTISRRNSESDFSISGDRDNEDFSHSNFEKSVLSYSSTDQKNNLKSNSSDKKTNDIVTDVKIANYSNRCNLSADKKKSFVFCQFPECGKKLVFNSVRTAGLEEHVRIHAGVPRECAHCGVKYSNIYQLRRHHLSVHPDVVFETPDTCDSDREILLQVLPLCLPGIEYKRFYFKRQRQSARRFEKSTRKL